MLCVKGDLMEEGDILFFKKGEKYDLKVIAKSEADYDKERETLQSPKIEIEIDDKVIGIELEEAAFLGLILIQTSLEKWKDFADMRKSLIGLAASKARDVNYVR